MITQTATREIVKIPLDKLHPHPKNRRVQIPECAELAATLKSDGQLQPILVRVPPGRWKLPIGHYQIVFGERRWKAAQIAGWEELDAEIAEDLDDAATLRLMCTENAQRQDLNPIEQARALKLLSDPLDEGGAGLSRAAAAAVFGLQTGPAATNKIRLLELPAVWQERVISGEIPETAARELVPYLHAKQLMAAIDRQFKKPPQWNPEEYQSREGIRQLIKDKVHRDTRPMTGRNVFHMKTCRSVKVRLEPDHTLRDKLQVVSIPNPGKRGGDVIEVAQNYKLYDTVEKKKADELAAKEAKPTPANQKKRERTKQERDQLAKQQAAQLGRRIHEWRQHWLRQILAERVKASDWQITKLLIYVAGRDRRDQELDAVLDDRSIAHHRIVSNWTPLTQCGADGASFGKLALDYSRAILWPAKEGQAPRVLDRDVVEGLAVDYGLDVEQLWSEEQKTPKGRARLEPLFNLHQRDQLEKLAKELGVEIIAAPTKTAAVKMIINVMQHRSLKLPRAIAPLAKAVKEKPKRR